MAAASAPSSSLWSHLTMAPRDPILGVTIAYNEDTHPNKINVGVGAYRTEEGKPYVLSVVRKAQQAIIANTSLNHEYLPIEGLAQFRERASWLIFGDGIDRSKIATAQALSGTGALRIAAEFFAKYMRGTTVYLSNPTWGNHPSIFQAAGLPVAYHRYFRQDTCGLDLDGMLADLQAAPMRSVILLHTCAHNPTGVDPSLEQWQQIAAVMQSRGHIALFDTAYQGFASGDLARDVAPIRMFLNLGFEVIVTQSFAKNMGLYGERIGAIHVACRDARCAEIVLSQLKIIIRAMISSPPTYGARIAALVMSTPELFTEWEGEMKAMSGRIQQMRTLLFEALKARGTPGNWNHVLSQIGMFTYTGLNEKQSELMTSKHHVHMTKNGRISMPGLSTTTVPLLADAIHDVVTTTHSNL